MDALERLREGKKSTVFKNEIAFTEAYQVARIPQREAEEKHLTDLAGPFVRPSGSPFNLFIVGKSGVGKTCVTRYVCTALTQYCKELGVNFRPVEVTCRKYHTELKALSAIQGALTGSLKAKKKDLVLDRITDELRRGLKVLVILDEIDKLDETNESSTSRLIENIVDLSTQGTPGMVSLICISNRVTLPERLTPKAQRFITANTLNFHPYNAQQLTKILEDRASEGFNKGVISQNNIALCAAYAAQTNGDARYGIQLLHASGKIAEKKRRKRIEKEDIQTARSVVEKEITFETIANLPEHEIILVYALSVLMKGGSNYKQIKELSSGVVFAGELYESYEKICKNLNEAPRTMRMIGNYLKELEQMGLISLSLSGSGFRGTTTLVRCGVKAEDLKRICEEVLRLRDA
jgi:archaeal cell division control protein 6